ncbi:MAG: hypothetical protein PHS47_03695 [Methanocellales archaeon]|nr:hypothetical protein [Methanocellales archaeon]MDD5446286.1 hypothetical protein [Methanocellales archaeon]
MLRIVNLEEIDVMLLRISSLIDQQERGDTNFAENVKEWLSKLEKILESNRMPVAGNVATLRGLLISAERGDLPSGVKFYGRPTRRKIREATTAYVIQQTCDLVSNVIQRDHKRFAEAECITRQLVALATAKGLIQELPSGKDNTDLLKALWRTLSNDPELSSGTVNVEGLIGLYDALIMLERTIAKDVPHR